MEHRVSMIHASAVRAPQLEALKPLLTDALSSNLLPRHNCAEHANHEQLTCHLQSSKQCVNGRKTDFDMHIAD